MSLSNIINGISKGWKEYKDHCKSTNPKGTEIKVVKPDHKIYDLIMSDWEKEVSKIVNSASRWLWEKCPHDFVQFLKLFNEFLLNPKNG